MICLTWMGQKQKAYMNITLKHLMRTNNNPDEDIWHQSM